MKQALETVKDKTSSTYVRAATVAASVVPIAAALGGVKLNNHNETVVQPAPTNGGRLERTLETTKRTTSSTYVRAAAVAASAVPIAAVLGGIHLSNHNETVVRRPSGTGAA